MKQMNKITFGMVFIPSDTPKAEKSQGLWR